MRTLQRTLLAGIAAAAFGIPGIAAAQTAEPHVMTVRLPDGGIAQIRYTGDVAPQVSFAPAPIPELAPTPTLFGADSPFAMMERISAEMDRQTVALLRQTDAAMAEARSGAPVAVALSGLTPGTESYSFVSTMSGNGVCTQSVEITSEGNGRTPRIVRHSSGNCGPAAGGSAGSVNLPAAPMPAARPDVIETRAHPARPYTAPSAPAKRPDVIYTAAKGKKPYAGLVREIPPAQR
jgi:hypothetical protein